MDQPTQAVTIADPPASPAPALARPPVPVWVHLLCALLVIGPYYGLAILNGAATLDSGEFELPPPMLLLYQALGLLTIFGGLSLILHVFVCKRPLRDFYAGRGTLLSDLLEGLGVYALLMGSVMVINLLMIGIRGESYVSDAVAEIAAALASDPLYVVIFLGPVVWLQAAILEEVTRAFLLLRLWTALPGQRGEIIGVVISALLFGLAHIYQGWAAVPAITVIGLVLGMYYQRRRRLLPLVIAHGLFDTTVMLIAYAAATYFPEMLK